MPGTSALAPFVGRPGLSIGIRSGLLFVNNSTLAIYETNAPVIANALNFVYLTLAPVVALAVNQAGFPNSNCLPIAAVLTNRSEVLDLVDYRPDWYLAASSGGGGGGGGASTVASVVLINQTASIGNTVLYAVPGGGAGMYRVSVDILVTMPGSGGTIQTNVSWNNGVTTSGLNSAPFSLAATGEQAALAGNFYSTGGQNITFSTTLSGAAGGPQYQISLRLEFLG